MPSRLLALRLYYFASFASLGAYIPFFPRWLEARGVTGIAMGAVAATIPLMGILGPPLIGFAADALGLRSSILRIACIGAFLAVGLIAAPFLAGHPPAFAALLAATLVYALFRSPMVMMADVLALEQARAANTTYGLIRLWGSAGFLGAVLVAGRWVDPRAPLALPIAIATPLFVAALAAFALPARAAAPLGRIATAHARTLLSGRAYPIFLALAFLAQVEHSSYDLCFSLHLRDLGAENRTVGVAWGIGVVFEIALMAAAAPLFARFRPPRLIAIALFSAALRWAVIASVSSVPLLVAAQPLHALSFGLFWISALAFIKEHAPEGALATAQGLFSAAGASGTVSGMLVWGPQYPRGGGRDVFAAASLLAAAACVIALFWSRRLRSGEPRAAPGDAAAERARN